MNPIRTAARQPVKRLQAARPNFPALWGMLVTMSAKVENPRFRAVLSNHSTRQEYICRKFGVVCSADVERLAKKLQKPIGKSPA